MDASKYRFLLSTLITALDAGRLQDLDRGEVRLYARAGAISILLGGAFPGAAEASSLSEEDWKSLNREVAAMAFQPEGAQPGKGETLLMSWMLQGLGQHM
jgi:hypothetical protein